MSLDRSSRAARIPGLLAAALLLAGCGESKPDLGRAVVVPEPGTSPTGAGSAMNESTDASEAVASPGMPTADVGSGRVAEGFGTLRGRVVFAGDPPERGILIPKGKATKDPQVCAAEEPILKDVLIVNPENKGVKNVLVYLPKPTAVAPEALSAKQGAEVVFDQENCTFEPHVLAVVQGSTVTIHSDDPVNHNVNVDRNVAPFNQAISPNTSVELKLDSASRSPGLVKCDVHPWMAAYWMVCDNPYFAVTDENGEFVIEDVPAGTQNLLVWHEATNYLTRRTGDPVDVEADGEAEVEFTMEPSQVKESP